MGLGGMDHRGSEWTQRDTRTKALPFYHQQISVSAYSPQTRCRRWVNCTTSSFCRITSMAPDSNSRSDGSSSFLERTLCGPACSPPGTSSPHYSHPPEKHLPAAASWSPRPGKGSLSHKADIFCFWAKRHKAHILLSFLSGLPLKEWAEGPEAGWLSPGRLPPPTGRGWGFGRTIHLS